MDGNLVVFKGRKDGITVVLDAESSFDELKDSLNRKVSGASDFFDGARISVNFKGRRLSEEEEDELIGIISEACNTEIIRQTKEVKKRQNKTAHTAPSMMLDVVEGMSVIYQGSLRSGQIIKYPGSVVIFGDINPGAEVIAEGSIVVFGKIKGLVHAGCTGDISCFVAGIRIEPVQLRIADIITYLPQSYVNKNRNKINPSYAYVRGDQIYIASLT